MGFATVSLILFFLVWFFLQLKTSRPDGVLIKKLHPYRRLLSYIQPEASSSVVYFDEYIKAENLLKFLDEVKKIRDIDMTHCLVFAGGISLVKNPQMNRFVKGYRLYQRKGQSITFTMKRKKLNKQAKVAAVKMSIHENTTLHEMSEKIHGKINVERSDKKTSFDVEANLFFKLPRPLMVLALKTASTLDYYNLLPSFMIRSDAMYTSAFIANLGSLGMQSSYHHLYDWGTCPHFITAGKIFDRPVVKNGQVTFEKSMNIRFSYDERIEDGLSAYEGVKSILQVLEDPENYLGSLKGDASQSKTFGELAHSLIV